MLACGDPGRRETANPGIDAAALGEVLRVDAFEQGSLHARLRERRGPLRDRGRVRRRDRLCTPLAEDRTRRCWVRCEADALGGEDPAQRCAAVTGPGCRSSGGGAESRDICAPP